MYAQLSASLEIEIKPMAPAPLPVDALRGPFKSLYQRLYWPITGRPSCSRDQDARRSWKESTKETVRRRASETGVLRRFDSEFTVSEFSLWSHRWLHAGNSLIRFVESFTWLQWNFSKSHFSERRSNRSHSSRSHSKRPVSGGLRLGWIGLFIDQVCWTNWMIQFEAQNGNCMSWTMKKRLSYFEILDNQWILFIQLTSQLESKPVRYSTVRYFRIANTEKPIRTTKSAERVLSLKTN